MNSSPRLCIRYLVQPPDSVNSIAEAHTTTPEEIRRINGIGEVSPGAMILVPVDQCLAGPR